MHVTQLIASQVICAGIVAMIGWFLSDVELKGVCSETSNEFGAVAVNL